jgi:hypothetical protein
MLKNWKGPLSQLYDKDNIFIFIQTSVTDVYDREWVDRMVGESVRR